MVNPASNEDEGKGDPTPSAADNKDATPRTEQGQAGMRVQLAKMENKETRPISITEKDYNWILKIYEERRKATNREED